MGTECDVRCVRVDELLPDDATYAAALAALPAWRRRKVGAFRLDADRRRSVAVWLLLKRMLAERGIDADTLSVAENEFGKPQFASRPDIQFGLSHAGDRVMAAVADSPVGCDVERIEPLDDGVAEECLAPDELRTAAAIPQGPSRDRAFCRLWVRKESYAKARGLGLSLDLKSFSVLPGREPKDCSFEDFDFGDGHLGCAVTFRKEGVTAAAEPLDLPRR